jgi:hypothetical protein
MNAPLHSIGLNVACLHCGTPIQIPSLDHDVVGLETVQRVFEPAHNTAPRMDGRQPASTSTSSRTAEQPRREEQATSGPPEPPRPTQHASPCPEPIDAPAIDENEYDNDRPPVYDGRQQQSSGSGLHFSKAAHWICRAVYWGIFLLLFFSVEIHPNIIFLSLIWLTPPIWGIPPVGWKAAEFITSLIVTTFACPGCGEVFPCVGVWKCSCGYQDHQERHIVNFRCPNCHSRLGRMNCVRCGSTILIW